jgi:hypothetical protein
VGETVYVCFQVNDRPLGGPREGDPGGVQYFWFQTGGVNRTKGQ